ncbi:MaoC/PaaZ C-terminal domain-containing protein [Amycolatopsis vastitatis]|uniref:MaoC/PaaZ C-terminal domain-containing protein n=1 Tax=Amycolatopsis vastitatis TaxID=1905142 RepID=UPI0023E35783|nr:MaoC/PaaZ C-terminal domain-containing protein [Amycolatopsis vastitatis]
MTTEGAPGPTAGGRPGLPDLSKIGVWCDPRPFTVDESRLAAYAEATNDTNPDRTSGKYANPVFAVVPAWDTAFEMLKGTLDPELYSRSLHGEQDIRLSAPITAGMRLWTRAAVVRAAPASTGMTLSARALSVDDDDRPVVDQIFTMFIRGASLPAPAGEDIDQARSPAGSLTREVGGVPAARRLDADQSLRYSKASGDTEAVHLDVEVAKSFGFPDVINQGNCTFAIAAQDVMRVVCDDDVSRVRRIAVRMSSPVLLDDTLTTRIYADDTSSRIFGWETVLGDGRLCLKSGLIEVGPPPDSTFGDSTHR